MTIEERAARRFGSEARASRMNGAPVEEIDGKTNPELFFPSELFTSLVRSGFVHPTADLMRKHTRQTSDDLFRTQADWQELEAISIRFIASLKKEHEMLRRIGAAPAAEKGNLETLLTVIQIEKRAEEVVALRETRAHFGRERFDRFLYLVIAPSKGLSIRSLSDSAIRGLITREENAQ